MGNKTSKTLICVPCGGLNDSFSAIGKCFDLCFASKEFDELLICDSYSDGLMGQLDKIVEFKKTTRRDSKLKLKRILKIRPSLNSEQAAICNTTELASLINSSNKLVACTDNFPCDGSTKALFDWMIHNSIPSEELIKLNSHIFLFIGFAGGPPSRAFLRSLQLKNKPKEKLVNVLNEIPLRYDSVHVRNTDIQTDYEYFFRSIEPKIKSNRLLLICSDDPTMEDKAKHFFGADKIFNKISLVEKYLPFTLKPEIAPGTKLHDPLAYANSSEREIFVLRSLVDLYALANSNHFFFGKAKQSYSSKSSERAISGYSLLAEMLKKDSSLLDRSTLIREVKIKHSC